MGVNKPISGYVSLNNSRSLRNAFANSKIFQSANPKLIHHILHKMRLECITHNSCKMPLIEVIFAIRFSPLDSVNTDGTRICVSIFSGTGSKYGVRAVG